MEGNNYIEEITYSKYKIIAETFSIVEIDDSFTKMLGYTMQDIIDNQMKLMDIMLEEDWEEYSETVARLLEKKGEAYLGHRLKKKNGDVIYVFCFGKLTQPDEQGIVYGEILISDISNTMELKRQVEALAGLNVELSNEISDNYKMLQLILNNLAGGVAVFDVHNKDINAQFVSDSFFDMFDIKKEQVGVTGDDFINLAYPDERKLLRKQIQETLVSNKSTIGVYKFYSMNEHADSYYVQVCLSVISARKGVFTLCAVILDVTDIHEEEEIRSQELMLRAERDSLTGIYNHQTFVNKVNMMLPEYIGSTCALYMVDLDDFKLVNDALGHYAGDDLLCDTAAVLEKRASEYGGFSGRLGGDEFALFIPDIVDEETAAGLADCINVDIRAVKCKAIHTSSIGVTVNVIDDRMFFDKMYSQADEALYTSKRHGKDRFMMYNKEIKEVKTSPAGSIGGYADDVGYHLDDINNIIYVCDMSTYELYYMNKAAKQALGYDSKDNSYIGCKCYEMIQGLRTPCNFCTNKLLSENKSYVSAHRNRNNHKDYILKDKIISWHGKKCRMEIAVDVSDHEKITKALAERYDMEDALTTSIIQISTNKKHGYSYQKLLETMGAYYGARHTCIIEYGNDNEPDIHEWKTETASFLEDKLLLFAQEDTRKILSGYSSEKGVLMINKLSDISDKDTPLYDFFLSNRLWSLYSVPIKNSSEQLTGRLMVFNPQLHNGDVNLMNILSIYIGNDIENRALAESRNYELTHDRVTQIYNRSSFIEYANKKQSFDSLGIAVIDVNDSRNVYDEFGQTFLDDLFKHLVDSFRKVFPDPQIFRVGEDDFIVVCENVERDMFVECIDTLKSTYLSGEFSACVGYVWDDYDVVINKMERHAYDILYMEKQKWYDEKDEHSYKWSTMSRELVKDDISQGYFTTYLQPKVNYANGKFYGAEALLRYGKEDSLASVIERLERTKTIKYVDMFVLEEVCKMFVSWKEKNIPLIPVSCNFSRISLFEIGMPEKINEIVESYGVPKNMIEIEITESIGEMEQDMAYNIAKKLHDFGFRIAMDDFGTMYSNLSIIESMRFDVIKLDRSMVYNIDKSEVSYKILKHLVNMCRDLGIECIAEGVETEKQAEYLKEMGCTYIQGFLYSKPVDIKTFEGLYTENMMP
jgi:diguanylate cyclase (GGDEF)-like protein/PAS domain S-box-containing protein